MVRFAVATLALVSGLSGSARAEGETPSYLAYKAYAACMEAPVAEYARHQGSPVRIAAKIAELCVTQEQAMQEAYAEDFLALQSDPDSAAEEARLIVQQITSNVRETIRAQIVLARSGQ